MNELGSRMMNRLARLAQVAGWDGPRLSVIVLCTLLVALLWIGIAYQLSFERNYVVEQREATNDNLVRLFEEHVQRTLAAASVTLKQLESEYKQHGERFDLAQYVHDRQNELEPYNVLSVVDEHGNLLLSSVPFTTPQNFRNHENTRFHMRVASQDVFIAKPRIGTLTGRPTIYITRRMNKRDGSFGGNTGVGMDPGYFSRFYDQIDLGLDSVVVLIGRDGVIRASRSNVASSEQQGGRDISSSQLFRVHLTQAEHGRFRATGIVDGIARFYSYRSVDNYPLIVLVGTSEAATLARFDQRKEVYLWSAGVASIIIFAFAALFVHQMARAARVAEGLRMSEDRYALIARATNDGIWDRNLRSGESYLSPHGKEILGYGGDEPCAGVDAFFGRMHPDDNPKVKAALEQSVLDRKPYSVEYRVRHKNGGYRWVLSRGEVLRDANGEPQRMIGSITDITQRKNSERHTHEQARLLDLIFRHSLDSIVLLDKDYDFIRVSESYAKACQRDIAEFAGHNHFELYPSSLQQELEPFRRAKKIYSRTARPFFFPDHPELGTTYWDLGLVPILGRNGEIELFLFTLKDVTAHVRAEVMSADYMARLRALSGRLVDLQEEERRALARELHDEIGQGLTAVKIYLQAMEQACQGRDMSFSTQRLHDALDAVATILEQVRSMSLNLRPMQLDDLGLTVALSVLVARDAEAADWIVHFDENLSAERLDSNLELACYRVAQEALTNVMRHAGATEVWVVLERSDQALLLTVRDNGHGFDLASARSTSGTRHLGVLGMEERVKNMAGQFEIRTRHGEGTEVRANFAIATIVAESEVLA